MYQRNHVHMFFVLKHPPNVLAYIHFTVLDSKGTYTAKLYSGLLAQLAPQWSCLGKYAI